MRLERAGSKPTRSRQRLVAVVPPPDTALASDLERQFVDIYRAVHVPMIAHAERFLDSDAAYDAAAEAAADAWTRWHLLRPEQRTEAYFMTAVHNAVLDALRVSRVSVTMEDAEEELERQVAVAMEPITYGDSAADVVDLAIAAMPPRRREVILFVKESGYTYQEVAAAIGLSVGTVNKHMHLAIKDLKTAFIRAGFRIEDVQPHLLPNPEGGAIND